MSLKIVLSPAGKTSLWTLAAVLLVPWLAIFLLKGIATRRRLRRMAAEGIPIPQPHSLLFGHLLLLRDILKPLPADVHHSMLSHVLVRDWKTYFPTAKECPPVIYLDLWPIMNDVHAMLVAPDVCTQLTQEASLPKHPMFIFAEKPITHNLGLMVMNRASHKFWRPKFNVGFLPRNLVAHMDVLVEEVSIFTQQLKDRAGQDGSWSEPLTLYNRAVSLTLDVVGRAVADVRLHEQTSGPGPVQQAIHRLLSHCKYDNIISKIERLSPIFRRSVSRHSEVLRKVLQPHAEAQWEGPPKSGDRQTITRLTVKALENSGNGKSAKPIDIMVANMKLFLFAGHDTTSQTICWIIYELDKHPEVSKKLREEHAGVFGADLESIKETLLKTPQTLNELPYTAAVIKETLRLHALVGTFRQASPGFSLMHEGMSYPAEGMLLATVPTAVHVRPDLWPHAAEFMPERFLVPEGDALYPPRNAFRPFELGPGQCVGKELAMMQIKLVLVFVLSELDIEVNYPLWDKAVGRSGRENKAMVNGERAYRSGRALGKPKDDLPVRVRLRGSKTD